MSEEIKGETCADRGDRQWVVHLANQGDCRNCRLECPSHPHEWMQGEEEEELPRGW